MSSERERIDDAKRSLESFLRLTEPILTESSKAVIIEALDRPVNDRTIADFVKAHSCPRSLANEMLTELIQFKEATP